MEMENLGKTDFEKLFREHYSQGYYYAFQITHDEETSRDIVSESFAALWKNRYAIAPSKFLGYLMVSVRNRSISHLRQQSHMATVGEEALGHMPAENESQWMQREMRIRAVEEEMARLPERTRYVLEQCYYQHRTYADVGEELQISVSGVKKHIVKAMSQLRSHFNTDKHISGA